MRATCLPMETGPSVSVMGSLRREVHLHRTAYGGRQSGRIDHHAGRKMRALPSDARTVRQPFPASGLLPDHPEGYADGESGAREQDKRVHELRPGAQAPALRGMRAAVQQGRRGLGAEELLALTDGFPAPLGAHGGDAIPRR